MKTIALLIGVLTLAAASVDLSKVKRIEELDEFWAQLDPQLQMLRPTQALVDSRIVNGQEAQPGQFPYQVLTLNIFNGGTGGICGGTLLSQNFVLTAAHCVVIGTVAINVTVVLGAHNRQLVEETQQRIDFESINVHPDYDAFLLRNDIATIRLATLAVFNNVVQPIDLPARSDTRTFAGLMGTISGFGRSTDETGSPASDVVRYTSNPIITVANCQSLWNSNLIDAQNICLSGTDGRSVCHGDSGGPLTIRDNDRSLQVGIASFVHFNGCASGLPSGYVRITHYLTWIGENSDVVLRD
ncbi:brachyurin-like [Topomyia yanbarensis]|uniref:brachyurin-like n=1 Tax=Topomyia yanbarensis TaxID=2498891 RepID=UPI00273C57B9|nr:brachyurin-like [Topomyia yanbarensis]